MAALLRRNWGALTEKCKFRARVRAFPLTKRRTCSRPAGLHVMAQSAKQGRAGRIGPGHDGIKKARTSDGGHDRTEIGIPWHHPACACRAGGELCRLRAHRKPAVRVRPDRKSVV